MLSELVEMLDVLEKATGARVQARLGVYPGGVCFRFDWEGIDVHAEYEWKPHQLEKEKEITDTMVREMMRLKQKELLKFSKSIHPDTYPNAKRIA